MAQQDKAIIIGIDVCKDTLDIFEHESGRAYSIGNDAGSIETWLDGKAGHLQVALEPTNRYHEAVAEAAYARGHEAVIARPAAVLAAAQAPLNAGAREGAVAPIPHRHGHAAE